MSLLTLVLVCSDYALGLTGGHALLPRRQAQPLSLLPLFFMTLDWHFKAGGFTKYVALKGTNPWVHFPHRVPP